jgi:hypothetical protein
MKVMFLDESGDHGLELSKIDKSYPMFVLAGCIFDFEYYVKNVEPTINELKIRYFGKTNLIFRSYNIRKQKGDFSSLVDIKKRVAFYEDINKAIGGFDMTIIAAAINKFDLIDQYITPANPYSLCLRFILERAIMYLGRSSESMILRAESRESHNDNQLATVYENFRQKGFPDFIKPDEVQRKLVDLSFNQKSQNIPGHQLADLVAYPIGRWVLDSKKDNKPFGIIEKKLHKKNGLYLNCGLKIFPDKSKGGPGKP